MLKYFYLDTNIFDALVGEATNAKDTQMLRCAVLSMTLQVLGSVELLEEFAGLYRRDQDKHSRVVRLFWELCSKHILRPCTEIMRQEIQKGRKLSLREACFSSDDIRKIRAFSLRTESLDEIIEGVRQQKESYVSLMKSAGEELERCLSAKINIRKEAGAYRIDRTCVREWGKDFVRCRPQSYGLPSDETKWPDFSQLPCFSAYLAIAIGLRLKRHEALRKDKGSDDYDVMHYALAAMRSGLVTNDDHLIETARSVEWHPVPLLSLSDFLRTVRHV